MSERTHVQPAPDPHAELLRFLAELLVQDHEHDTAAPTEAAHEPQTKK